VALSSGEAELYALVKGASQSLGMIALASDMGYECEAKIWSDSSAAIGISQRKGLGKLRHIKVQWLWIQDSLKRRDFALGKVEGADNQSDILTKNVDATTLNRHLATMDFIVTSGRATAAPTLSTLYAIILKSEASPCNGTSDSVGGRGDNFDGGEAADTSSVPAQSIPAQSSIGSQNIDSKQAVTDDVLITGEGVVKENGSNIIDDDWIEDGDFTVRRHLKPRTRLFTPIRVSGAPSTNELSHLRITVGTYCNSSSSFKIVDSWSARATAHRDLGASWTGATYFCRKGECVQNLPDARANVYSYQNVLVGSSVGGFREVLAPR